MRKRHAARWVINKARRYLPLRGVAKVSFLQCLAVARTAARRIGELLVADGLLDDAEDVFMLTRHELVSAATADTRELVTFRWERFEHYRTLDLPMTWQGRPTAHPLEIPGGGPSTPVSGIGVSPGIVEGRVCVVLDPADADMEEGDILVALTTDPSWASVMFLAAALVVDIGGPLSHAAVVAREMGVPCVMGTGTGTMALRTGDRVRVNGAAGTVEVL